VFDGKKGKPYLETDVPKPVGVYGSSKLAGEQAISTVGGKYLILRTSWLYSLRRDSFVTKVLKWARQNTQLRIVTDQVGNPTWARMLAEISAQLLVKAIQQIRAENQLNSWLGERKGIYHLAGSGFTSRLEWARAILQFDPHPNEQVVNALEAAYTTEFPTPAQRPIFSALNCDQFTKTFGLLLPPWEEALKLAMEAE
jgi:dTDP-4-dehydrorhamnose reductase